MSHHLPSFVSLSPNSSMSIVTNDDSVPLSDIGTIVTPSLSLYDVYYILGLAMNLASIGKISDFGYNLCFSISKCFVQDHTSHEVIEIVHRQGGLNVLNHFKEPIVATSSVDLSSFHLSSCSPFLFVAFSFGSCFCIPFKVFSVYMNLGYFG